MDPQFGYHPNLTIHAETDRTMFGASNMDQGAAAQVYGDIDNCPRTVALLVAGALVAVVGMKALGFRFAIGVGT